MVGGWWGAFLNCKRLGFFLFKRPDSEGQGHEFNAVNDLGRLDVEIDAPITPAHPRLGTNHSGWMGEDGRHWAGVGWEEDLELINSAGWDRGRALCPLCPALGQGN